MEDLDINNGINTLDTIYFFKCAKKQGYNQTMLEQVLMHYLKISRETAISTIYSAVPHYYQNASDEECVDFLINYMNRTITNKSQMVEAL